MTLNPKSSLLESMILRYTLLLGLVIPSATSAAVLSIAHRGDSTYAPENTVAAFKSALGKSDFVETDAQPSADGVLVIMHDGTVDRTTDGAGSVAGQTLAQLKLLDAGSWFSPAFTGERVPTLEEMVTNTLPAAIPLIERKGGTAEAYVNELRRLGVVTNVMVQAFDWNFLAAVHALEPRIRLGALGGGRAFTSTDVTNVINTGSEMAAWEASYVTAETLNLIHSAGLKLFVWTVDGGRIKTYIDMGVDGIISNDPGSVRSFQVPILTNGPVSLSEEVVSYWKMDDGLTNSFATNIVDSKGTNHAVLYRNDGASHWFDGTMALSGGALKVEGANAYAVLPASESLNINTNEMSISAWVRLSTLPSQMSGNYGPIFDSTTDCYVLYMDKANKELRFKVTDAAGHAARPGIPESQLPLNEWIHIVGTYSGSALTAAGRAVIYLNGEVMDFHTGSDSSPPIGLTGNIKTGQIAAIGREGPTGSVYFTGFVDEIAIWRRALNANEVSAIYAGGLTNGTLASLMRGPTEKLRCLGAIPQGLGTIQIQFLSEGSWKNFRLLQADSITGPFQPVGGLAPVDLGDGKRGFNYAINGKSTGYFRVEAD